VWDVAKVLVVANCRACLQHRVPSGCNMIPMCIAKKQKKGSSAVCANLQLLCCACLQHRVPSGCNMIPMCIAKKQKRGSSLLCVLICNYFVALVCNV
jgi:hypothetical protein